MPVKIYWLRQNLVILAIIGNMASKTRPKYPDRLLARKSDAHWETLLSAEQLPPACSTI